LFKIEFYKEKLGLKIVILLINVVENGIGKKARQEESYNEEII